MPVSTPWPRGAVRLLAFAAILTLSVAGLPAQEAGGGKKKDDAKPEGALRVVGNVYFDLPGLDMTTLTPTQRLRFLRRVNKEHCLCGRSTCVRDPVANCYVNDPGCGHAKTQARRILDEVKAGK